MVMSRGYPVEADIDSSMSARGLEVVPAGTMPFTAENKKFAWGILNALDWAMALGVYFATATTFNVRGGKYLFKGEPKTYTPGNAVDPTDNDTTYVWMKDDNTISSGIDGNGWPATEHIKLAEITVNSEGTITAITDLRGRTFLQYLATYLTATGTSVQALPIHWNKDTPANDDEIRIPIYGENDNDEKIEYARIVVKFTDVADGTEDATVSLMKMIAGALTTIGEIVGTSGTQTLTNKTINCASNTITNVDGTELANYSINGGVGFILTAELTGGNTVQIHNANAPFKYRVLDAWSAAKSADGGTWKLTDGTNDITDTVTVTGTDKTINKAGTVDDAYHEIAASGSLSVVGDGANADCDVYITCMRVS